MYKWNRGRFYECVKCNRRIYSESSSGYEVAECLDWRFLNSLGLDVTGRIGGSVQFFYMML